MAVTAAGAAILVVKCACSTARRPAPDEIPLNKKFFNWPVVGHLPHIKKLNKGTERGTAFFTDQAAVDGVCRVSAPGVEVVCVKSPALVKQLFTDLEMFGKTELDKHPRFQFIKKAIGNGIFTADDEDPEWGIAHRILTQRFSRDSMKSYVPMMNEQADRLLRLIRRDIGSGGIAVVNELFTKMALETISYLGMGTDFGSFESLEVHPFISDITNILKLTRIVKQSPFRCLVKKEVREFEACAQRAHAVVQEILTKRKKGETSSAGKYPDLLDLMLKAVDAKTGKMMTDQNIRDNIITMLIAGHDTTAATMSFFLAFVGEDPRIEAKLMTEMQQVVGSREDVRFEDLPKLKYMGYCLKETMRLQPPVRNILKIARKDGYLGKFRVQKSMIFMMPLMSLHMDKQEWGPDAEEFVPERWEKGLPHPFAHIPFGSGPRSCIGMEFSLTEQKVLLVKLLRGFSFRRPEGETEVELEDKLFVAPTNFKMQVFERLQTLLSNSQGPK